MYTADVYCYCALGSPVESSLVAPWVGMEILVLTVALTDPYMETPTTDVRSHNPIVPATMNARLSLLLLWWHALQLCHAETLNDVDCTLPCRVGSSCAFGESPWATPGEATSIDGMHCQCPPDRVGVKCEVSVQECDETHRCYHGGLCIASIHSAEIDLTERFCDCSGALDEFGNLFVGKFCEHKAASFCQGDSSRFCLHGGTCNPPGSLQPCLCPAGLTGDHCQFNDEQVPECDMACQNGGICVLGSGDDDTEGLMHCRCPEGFTGKYCDAHKTPCGPDQYCYNGSTCVPRNIQGGGTIYQCDCTTANNQDALFAGRYCQYQATSYCTLNPTVDGHLFCVNGGQCNHQNPVQGCDCQGTGFGGFSCEIPTYDNDGDGIYEVPEDQECNLACENGGVCRNGAKELGLVGDFAGDAAHLGQTYDPETFQHCACPDGFTGLQCEHKVEICAESEHLCLHGSKCVHDGQDHACDCSQADGTYTGNSCQHPANDICTYGQSQPGQAVNFCVNQGECLSYVAPGQPHPGCECQDGWTGPHCEIRGENAAKPLIPEKSEIQPQKPSSSKGNNQSDDGNMHGFLMFMAVLGFLAIPSAAAAYCFYLRQRRRQQREQLHNSELSWASKYRDEDQEVNIAPRRSSVYDDVYMDSIRKNEPGDFLDDGDVPPPQVYLGPPRDEDGHELHSVEII